MASKTPALRFTKLINQQMEMLKGERKTVLEAVDDAIDQVQSELDTWINAGNVNQTTWAQMNNRLQQVINLLMTKSLEIADLDIKEQDSNPNQMSCATSSDSVIPKIIYNNERAEERTMIDREETLKKSGVDTAKFNILEAAVLLLKKTTEQTQEKQENVTKKLEMLTNANLKSKQKFQERLTVLEKTSKEICSNVDHLFETVTNVDDKLNRLEEENKSVNVSLNELNDQITSLDASSNDAYMSIQNLSKSVESTNQHYNEMSNKMNQLEIAINMMSTQYTEQAENMNSQNKDKVDDLIGMVCQLLSKRLFPLKTLNETLNKKVILSKEHISKIKALDRELAEISGKFAQIENSFNQPTLLFNACKIFDPKLGCNDIGTFDDVSANYGSHFNPSSGIFTAPLNGFYSVTIDTNGKTNNSFSIRCYHNVKDIQKRINRPRQLCCVTDDECVTCSVELKAGEELILRLETEVENIYGLKRIQVSCFMIK